MSPTPLPVTVRALWGMARPLILVSVGLVFANGLLIARAQGHPILWIAVLWSGCALLLVSVSIHYVNEYADVETDARTRPTRYSGGSGVLPSGTVPRALALRAAAVSLALGFAVAVAGTAMQVIPAIIPAYLFLGAALGWAYSLPPPALAWRGWGEVDNAFLGGILLHGYGHATASGAFSPAVVAICLPFTLLTFNNLLATGWADREADAAVDKRTLATRLSAERLRQLYAVVAACAGLCLAGFTGWLVPVPVALASLLALPLVLRGWATFTRIHEPYPTSNAMVALLLLQMAAWYGLGEGAGT